MNDATIVGTGMPLLELSDIHLAFGGLKALSGINISIYPGEFFSLIGPNGAGKTSVINCISGFYRPTGGKITFAGIDITKKPSYQRTQLGICRTFQNVETFQSMTVLDQIRLGAHCTLKSNPISSLVFGSYLREEIELNRFIEQEILEVLGLQEVKDRQVYSLPYGMQKRVDLGRALATRPKLLVLDEPVAGMNQKESLEMVRCILRFKEQWDLTILLVEHDMEVVMEYSDRVSVVNFGNPVNTGTPKVIQQDPEVVSIYLGGGEH